MTRVAAIAAMAAQIGCASLINSFGEDRHPYAGVRVDAHIIGAPFDASHEAISSVNLFQWPFAFVDLPLSLVMDTLLLPYTAMKPQPP
jgi:uncharacterized protein YceK